MKARACYYQLCKNGVEHPGIAVISDRGKHTILGNSLRPIKRLYSYTLMSGMAAEAMHLDGTTAPTQLRTKESL